MLGVSQNDVDVFVVVALVVSILTFIATQLQLWVRSRSTASQEALNAQGVELSVMRDANDRLEQKTLDQDVALDLARRACADDIAALKGQVDHLTGQNSMLERMLTLQQPAEGLVEALDHLLDKGHAEVVQAIVSELHGIQQGIARLLTTPGSEQAARPGREVNTQ